MGAGERETLGRTSGASAELLACGDGGLKPPVEKRVKPVSQLYCRTLLLQVLCFNCTLYIHFFSRAEKKKLYIHCSNCIVPTLSFYNVPTLLFPPGGGEGWIRGRGRLSRSMSCSDEALSSGSVFLRSVSSRICISQISVSRDLYS